MKLGLSQACYRWVFEPHLRRDSVGYLTSGERLPYFSSIPISVDEAEAPEWLIRRCDDLGLEFLYLTTSLLKGRARADHVRRYGADRGVTVIGGAHANWVATGDAWRPEYERYVAQVPIAAAVGARVLCTTHGAPAIHREAGERPLPPQQGRTRRNALPGEERRMSSARVTGGSARVTGGRKCPSASRTRRRARPAPPRSS
jgi:hypothetical protein